MKIKNIYLVNDSSPNFVDLPSTLEALENSYNKAMLISAKLISIIPDEYGELLHWYIHA